MQTVFATIAARFPELSQAAAQQSPEEYARQQAEWYNSSWGALNNEDGVYCEACRNKGYIQRVNADGQPITAECGCMRKRRQIKALVRSGLSGLLSKGFENFEVIEEWQLTAKNKAEAYSRIGNDRWLYFGGQHGCGKTHLCTAVCKALIDQGRDIRYMLWGDISQALNAFKYNAEEFQRLMGEIKSIDTLYIDDFLKTPTAPNGKPDKPNYEELKNAYTVINARYFANKKTIISSEHFMTEYEQYDGAAAGRIKEKCAGALIQIERNPDRNYRKRAVK